VGEALGAHFSGPEPGRFLARLEEALHQLPARDSQWDVLAAWARPPVVAAAMAAAFLLGVAIWQSGRERSPVPDSPVSMAILETVRPLELNPVINAVLEDR
jgi:hypothetical protein